MTERRLMKDADKIALTGGSLTALHSHPGGDGGGPAEKGIATTDAQGTVTVNFVGSYSSKPIVSLTPEYPAGTDIVIVQIDSWVGGQPPYPGMIINSADDGGKVEANVSIHWLIWI